MVSWCKVPVHQVANVLYDEWIYASEDALRKRVRKRIHHIMGSKHLKSFFLEQMLLLSVNFNLHVIKCHLQQRKIICMLLCILNQEVSQEKNLLLSLSFFTQGIVFAFSHHAYEFYMNLFFL